MITSTHTLPNQEPLIEAKNLTLSYPGRTQKLFARAPRKLALDDVNVCVQAGQSLAIVGESGSGKTTLIKALLGLERPDSGEITFDGMPVEARGRQLWLRRRTGIVFQDPYSSLNPRLTIGQTVAEPLEALGFAEPHHELVHAMLARLELPVDTLTRYPAEFSGGQRQRIALARALVHQPDLLVGDEPVSALDVLVRRKLLVLLRELRHELGLTMITVTHDLGVVPDLAERVLVLRRGRVVEEGSVAQIFHDPAHAYTKTLISSLPRLPEISESSPPSTDKVLGQDLA